MPEMRCVSEEHRSSCALAQPPVPRRAPHANLAGHAERQRLKEPSRVLREAQSRRSRALRTCANAPPPGRCGTAGATCTHGCHASCPCPVRGRAGGRPALCAARSRASRRRQRTHRDLDGLVVPRLDNRRQLVHDARNAHTVLTARTPKPRARALSLSLAALRPHPLKKRLVLYSGSSIRRICAQTLGVGASVQRTAGLRARPARSWGAVRLRRRPARQTTPRSRRSWRTGQCGLRAPALRRQTRAERAQALRRQTRAERAQALRRQTRAERAQALAGPYPS
jgi:hypothetical protein